MFFELDTTAAFEDAETENFLLINKDTIIAKFHFEEVNVGPGRKLPEAVLNAGERNLEGFSRISKVYSNINAFLKTRKPVKNREFLSDLSDMLQFAGMEGFIKITHGLSLNDTLWIKEESSSATWSEINLYHNRFNEMIAHFAFTGEGLHDLNVKSTSPEYGTNGMLPKCWQRREDTVTLVKGGTSGFSNTGLEPYSEYYAVQVLKAMGVDDYIDYGLEKFKGRLASTCSLFTDEQLGYMPMANITTDVTDMQKLYVSKGFLDKLATMVVFDSIICNTDRHLNNFGFMIDNDTFELIKPAPIFDNGLGLMPYFVGDNLDDLIEKANSEGIQHCLFEGFIPTARTFLTKELRQMCRRLINFKFTRHPLYNLPEERLVLLEGLVQHQVREILR